MSQLKILVLELVCRHLSSGFSLRYVKCVLSTLGCCDSVSDPSSRIRSYWLKLALVPRDSSLKEGGTEGLIVLDLKSLLELKLAGDGDLGHLSRTPLPLLLPEFNRDL